MGDQVQGGMLSPWLRERRLAAVRPHLRGSVLDFGCGVGALARHIAASDYVGVDTDLESIDDARRAHPNHDFLTVDDLPDARHFDTIVALAVIEHVPEPVDLVTDLAGRLQPGGTIVLTTPHRRWEFLHGAGARLRIFSPEASDEHHLLFDHDGLARLAESSGLELTRYERFLGGANQLAVLQPSGTASAVPVGNIYDKYGTTNPIERRMMSGFMDALDSLLPTQPPTRVLEVGAGEGHITSRMRDRYPSAHVTALDLADPRVLAELRSRGLNAVAGSVEFLPFPDDSFDLVLGIEVLEHVPNPSAALAEIARVSRGDVVLSVPREPIWRIGNMARGRYLRDLGNTPGHIQHWSSRAFRELVAEHLDVTAMRRPVPWTVVSGRVSRPSVTPGQPSLSTGVQ
jgi:2-polyprenyl-3-methyl-5-hydroxy-6-metoxy-1,4-benzoquinol methylase